MSRWVRERSRSSSPVNRGCWIVVFVWCHYLTILYRTPLYIKDVTFVSVPWVIICVRLDPSTHVSHARVCPLNLGVTAKEDWERMMETLEAVCARLKDMERMQQQFRCARNWRSRWPRGRRPSEYIWVRRWRKWRRWWNNSDWSRGAKNLGKCQEQSWKVNNTISH
jgi:hypothetical protein